MDEHELAQVAARFNAKVRSDGGHLVWTGAVSKGLGAFKLDGRTEKAPRVAWLLERGVLPSRPLQRLCDMHGCVTPAHHRERGADRDANQQRRTRLSAGKAGRRRARGQGHIRQRGANSYTIEVVTGRDPLNPRRLLRDTFTVHGTRDDAEARLAEYLGRARLGDRINEAAAGTCGELLDLWLDHARLEADTRKTYQGYIDNQIKPAVGRIPLRDLTTFDLDRFYKAVAERGGKCRHCWWRVRNGHAPLGLGAEYRPSPKAATKVHGTDCVHGLPLSPATQRHIHAIIHRALTQAKKWKLISVNPASDTSRTAVPEPVLRVPRPQEVALVLATASEADPNFGLFVWMTIITGGRRGEACGIRWSLIDADEGTLTIAEVIEGGGKPKPYPKNRKQRVLRLDPQTLSLLEAEHAARQQTAEDAGVALRPDAYVFAHHTTPDGSKPCDPDHLSKRFHRMCDLLGVQFDRNLYALRHFAATDLLRSGVDIRTIAGRLGNDPVIALRRYSHFVGEADRQAVAEFSTRLQDALTELGTQVAASASHHDARSYRTIRRDGWGWPGTPLFPSTLRARWAHRQLRPAVCRWLGLPPDTTAGVARFPKHATPTTAGRAVTTLATWFADPDVASLPLLQGSMTDADLGAVRWQGRTKALLARMTRQYPGGIVAWLTSATIGDLFAIHGAGPATVLDVMVSAELLQALSSGGTDVVL